MTEEHQHGLWQLSVAATDGFANTVNGNYTELREFVDTINAMQSGDKTPQAVTVRGYGNCAVRPPVEISVHPKHVIGTSLRFIEGDLPNGVEWFDLCVDTHGGKLEILVDSEAYCKGFAETFEQGGVTGKATIEGVHDSYSRTPTTYHFDWETVVGVSHARHH